MGGVLLVIMGVTGMGTAVKFMPRPIVIGFTNGIALLIASTQIKDFFGLQIQNVPGAFLPRMAAIAENFKTLSPPATTLAIFALVLMIVIRKLYPRIPGSILALLAERSPRSHFTFRSKPSDLGSVVSRTRCPHFTSRSSVTS